MRRIKSGTLMHMHTCNLRRMIIIMIHPPKVGRGVEGGPPDRLKALACHHPYHSYSQGGSIGPCHSLIRLTLMMLCKLSMAFLCSLFIVFWAWGRVSPSCVSSCCSVSNFFPNGACGAD